MKNWICPRCSLINHDTKANCGECGQQKPVFTCKEWPTRHYSDKPPVASDHSAWPIRGVRVEDDKVIIMVRGGNDVARWLCGEVLAEHGENK